MELFVTEKHQSDQATKNIDLIYRVERNSKTKPKEFKRIETSSHANLNTE